MHILTNAYNRYEKPAKTGIFYQLNVYINQMHIVQGQLLKIWHRMLIYVTTWIGGP